MNETKLGALNRGATRLAMLGCLLGVMLVPAYADLVGNGTFAGPPNPGSFTTLGTGSTAISGWTVTSGSVDWVGTYWGAVPAGSNSIDLDGDSPGAIATTITTVVNQTYDLSFYLSANGDGPPATKTMDVLVNGSQIGSDFTVVENGKPVSVVGPPPGYTLETVSFVAHATSSTLTFNSLDSGGAYGAVLANVSVVQASTSVPESSLAALALGFSGLIVAFIAAGLRRRKVA